MNSQIQSFVPKLKDTGLQLNPVQITDEYRKAWNVRQDDFFMLTFDGELINSSLYRIGGFGVNLKDNYFILLKQVESYYDDSITKVKKRKPHLAQCSCIVDKFGIEKKVCREMEYPYLVKDSVIYSLNGRYFNIETGEFYCEPSGRVTSSEFIFLENQYDKDKSRRGVWKI